MTEAQSTAGEIVEPIDDAATSVGGLTPEMAGVLAYLFSPVTGLLVFLMEEDDEFVRFHGVQSIVFGLLWGVIYLALTVISTLTLGLGAILFVPAVPVAFLMWGFLMYQAYAGKEWAIPGLEGFVRDQI